MSGIQEAIQKSNEENRRWYEANQFWAKLLGFSASDAINNRQHIETIKQDLLSYLRVLCNKLAYLGLLPAVVITGGHFLILKDYIKAAFLISYFIGLAGTFVATFWFFFDRKEILLLKEDIIQYWLHQQRRDEASAGVARELIAYLSDKEKEQVQQQWRQIRIELRKHVSLVLGFLLIAVSMIIQAVLQLFR